MRVKSRPVSGIESGLRTPSPYGARYDAGLPDIEQDDSFREVVKKLSMWVTSRAVIAHC